MACFPLKNRTVHSVWPTWSVSNRNVWLRAQTRSHQLPNHMPKTGGSSEAGHWLIRMQLALELKYIANILREFSILIQLQHFPSFPGTSVFKILSVFSLLP